MEQKSANGAPQIARSPFEFLSFIQMRTYKLTFAMSATRSRLEKILKGFAKSLFYAKTHLQT